MKNVNRNLPLFPTHFAPKTSIFMLDNCVIIEDKGLYPVVLNCVHLDATDNRQLTTGNRQ